MPIASGVHDERPAAAIWRQYRGAAGVDWRARHRGYDTHLTQPRELRGCRGRRQTDERIANRVRLDGRAARCNLSPPSQIQVRFVKPHGPDAVVRRPPPE